MRHEKRSTKRGVLLIELAKLFYISWPGRSILEHEGSKIFVDRSLDTLPKGYKLEANGDAYTLAIISHVTR